MVTLTMVSDRFEICVTAHLIESNHREKIMGGEANFGLFRHSDMRNAQVPSFFAFAITKFPMDIPPRKKIIVFTKYVKYSQIFIITGSREKELNLQFMMFLIVPLLHFSLKKKY